MPKKEIGKVTTTITMPEELWKRFKIKVIEDRGGRKQNDVLTELIAQWVERKN